jgi:transposase
MKELDGRKLNRKTLEELRIRAVKRVEAGESPEVIIKALGLSRPRIYEWIARYREGGIDALKSRTAPGRTPKLSGQQLQVIYKCVVGKNPLQMKLPFALWTCTMVRELIRREFDVSLSEVSVGRLLKKLGLTPQRPKWSAYQQDPKLAVSWITKDFPTIQKMAKATGAAVYFGDESSIRSDYHSGTTWALRGQTPTVKTTGSRFKLNMISAVNAQGTIRFSVTEKNLTSEVFIDFLKGMLHDESRPVFLIVDQHPVHRSKQVLDFVASTNGRLCIFYLPPYSPEFNPDELVWNHVKNHGIGRMVIKGFAGLKEMVIARLRHLQQTPDIVRGFFRYPIFKACSMFANQ